MLRPLGPRLVAGEILVPKQEKPMTELAFEGSDNRDMNSLTAGGRL